MKKNSVLFTSSLLFALCLCSCGTKEYKVSIFRYDSSDTFTSSLVNNIVSKGVDDYTFTINDGKRSQLIQNEQILKAIDDNDDMLLVNMVDRLAASAIIEKAKSKSKKLILFNREPLPEDMANQDVAYYVGSNPTFAGELQASLTEELFGLPNSLNPKYDKNGDNKIQLVILKGEVGHQDAEKRTNSYIEKLANDGYDVDLLQVSVGNWNKEVTYSNFIPIYEEYNSSIEMICSNNDDMAAGAIQYLLEKNVLIEHTTYDKQPIQILGVDGTTVGINNVNAGYMAGTVLNDGETQADAIIELIKYIKENKSFSDFKYPFVNGKYIFINGKIIKR